MLATLAIVVFFSSIVVFFSSELMSTVKAIAKNRFFQIVSPLILASWFVISYQHKFLWFLVTFRIDLFYISYFLNKILPSIHSPLLLSRIIDLFVLSVLLIGVADIIEKFWKKITNLRIIALYISPFIWLITAFLYAVGISDISSF